MNPCILFFTTYILQQPPSPSPPPPPPPLTTFTISATRAYPPPQSPPPHKHTTYPAAQRLQMARSLLSPLPFDLPRLRPTSPCLNRRSLPVLPLVFMTPINFFFFAFFCVCVFSLHGQRITPLYPSYMR